MNDRQLPPLPAATGLADPRLPPGTRLGPFELQRLIARSASSVVYLATDHALAITVAIQEYLPARLVHRDATLRLRAVDEWHEDTIARGLRAFVDEARLLAHCDHPALVRVHQLFEAHGTAYRVMPFYTGRRLLDIRRDMPEAPDEASLRGLLDDLLGALEAIHHSGRAHGGVTPGNIMLLGDDRPLLLGPGAAGREIGSDLVESLMATVETSPVPKAGARAGQAQAQRAVADLCALAEVTRFCITGTAPVPADPARPQTLAEEIVRHFEPALRPRYSAELLRSLDAALSPHPADLPTSAAQFRGWLNADASAGAAPPAPQRAEPVFDPFSAAPAPPQPAAPVTPPRVEPVAAEPPVFAAPPTKAAPAMAHAAPIGADRAPWAAPPPARAPNRARGYKLALGAALAVAAVGVLGLVSGGWNIAPEIAIDRPLIAVPAHTAQAPPPAAPVVIPQAAPIASPAPEPAAPPIAAPPATTAEAPAASAAVAAAPLPAATEPPPSEPAPPPVAALEPERLIEQSPPAAGPRPAPPRAAPPRNPARTSAGSTAGGNPRASCSGRTEFALYRCMQQVCKATRWQMHPQCVRLRANDRVD